MKYTILRSAVTLSSLSLVELHLSVEVLLWKAIEIREGKQK